MPSRDKRIDVYIAQSADFAKPILKHFRALVHEACSDIEETMKWSFPHFDYKGILCSMAAFKQHYSFGFWKTALMKEKLAMDKITSLKEMPADKKIIAAILDAIQLNEQDIKLPKNPVRSNPKDIVVPEDLRKSLTKNKSARETFEKFSPSHRREYIEWIIDAKTEPTRKKRLDTAIEWMSEGKSRHWKYVK